MMVQCLMEKKTNSGTLSQLSWIPEKFAIDKKIVKIKEGKEWNDGWIIKKVCHRMEDEEQAKLERVWKKHREVTDI